MRPPLISVSLITVRGVGGYVEHPEWHVIDKIVDDLTLSTFKNFELIVVTPLPYTPPSVNFPITVLPPHKNIWTDHRKVAIAAARNTTFAAAKGELIVCLDDCCTLPPEYLSVFAQGWTKYHLCAAATWPSRMDWRRPQLVDRPGLIFGFGSVPREAVLEINGVDEAFDGSQGLEDADLSTRLFYLGVKSALVDIPGFDILPQTGHHPDAIDSAEPIVKCCNAAWNCQRVWRQVRRANVAEVYTKEALERLVPGPCIHRSPSDVCAHHRQPCAYLGRSWLDKRHPLVEEWMKSPPVFDLRELSHESH